MSGDKHLHLSSHTFSGRNSFRVFFVEVQWRDHFSLFREYSHWLLEIYSLSKKWRHILIIADSSLTLGRTWRIGINQSTLLYRCGSNAAEACRRLSEQFHIDVIEGSNIMSLVNKFQARTQPDLDEALVQHLITSWKIGQLTGRTNLFVA